MESLPTALFERLNIVERRLVEAMSGQKQPPAKDPADCVRELKRMRYDRERAAVQREIDRLQEEGGDDQKLVALLNLKHTLTLQIESSR